MTLLVHFLSRVWHVLGLHEARRFERFSLAVELLVLWVIAYEAFWRPWRARRWIRRVYEYFSSGQALFNSAPHYRVDGEHVEAWNVSVSAWYRDTRDGLAKESPQSAAAFLLPPMRPMLALRDVHTLSHDSFRLLGDALENLKGIMEKADVYF